MQRLRASKYATVAIPVRLWSEISKVVEASGAYASEAEFVRDAVREKLQQVALREIRDMPERRLRQLVVDYIQKNGQAYPSDLAADLGVPYFAVTSVIGKLVEEGLLEPATSGSH